MDKAQQDALKKAAGIEAAKLIQNGMIAGLGTGSTVRFLVDELGRRVKEEGLEFTGVTTSRRTQEQAEGYGIKIVNIDDVDHIDVTIDGADEVDIVLNVGRMLTGEYDEAANEVEVIRTEMDDDVVLKVIIESGALKTPELIRKASLLSMLAGADFVKTSTGKIDVAATPEAAVVMCQAIRDYYDKTGRKVGFKAAGGVRTAEDAALYYTIVEEILGKEWLTTELFRIGASSTANNILSAIEGSEVKYF